MSNTPPNYPSLEYQLEYGEANLHYAIHETFKQNYKKALEYINAFLNICPENEEGIYNKAVILFFLDEYNNALKCFFYLQKQSHNLEVIQDSYYFVALISKKFKYDQAVLDFCDKALEINPLMFEAYFEKAIVNFNNKDYYKSLIEIKNCINALSTSNIKEKMQLIEKIKNIKSTISRFNNISKVM